MPEAYQAMRQAMVSAGHDAMRDIVEGGATFTRMSGETQSKEELVSEAGAAIDGDQATLTGTVALAARAHGSEGTLPPDVHQRLHRVSGRWRCSRRA